MLLIELDGTVGGGSTSCLTIKAAGSTVRGLVINKYLAGIIIAADECNVFGNFVGTDPTGKISKPNKFGVTVFQGDLHNIGWTTAADRNVISGNSINGIYIDSDTATRVRIYNNYVGVDASGTKALGNAVFGIALINSNDTEIGAPGQGKGNLISGNSGPGIEIHSAGNGATVHGVKVQNNLIGTNAAGTGNIGNAGIGVWLDSTVTSATIGGQGAGEAGILATGNVKATFSGNVIYSNDQLGIDLSKNVSTPDGVTPNDNNDSDAGPNGLQNFPQLDSVESANGQVVIRGRLESVDQHIFRIEFFANPVSDPTGFGEGEDFIGSRRSLSRRASAYSS